MAEPKKREMEKYINGSDDSTIRDYLDQQEKLRNKLDEFGDLIIEVEKKLKPVDKKVKEVGNNQP